MLPLYAPPAVEVAWHDDLARRLVLEIEGMPGATGRVRARCRDGERVVVDTNQLFARPGGHTSNVLMYEGRDVGPCELTVQDFLDEGPRLVACFDGGVTDLGPCEPAVVPAPAADGRTTVHDVDARIEDHPIGGPGSLNFGYRVRMGRDFERQQVRVWTTVRCRGRVVEEVEHWLDSVFSPVAGESWVIRQVIAGAAAPCELDVALAVRRPGSVFDWDREPLGTFPVVPSPARWR